MKMFMIKVPDHDYDKNITTDYFNKFLGAIFDERLKKHNKQQVHIWLIQINR